MPYFTHNQNEYYLGWKDDPAAVTAAIATLPHPELEPLAQGLLSTPEIDALFTDLEERVLGKRLDNWDQGQVGDCVGEGSAWTMMMVRVGQIALGQLEEFDGEEVPEVQYGLTKECGNDLSRQDGACGAWALQAAMKYGGILRGKYGSVDLNEYSADVAKQYGWKGVPDSIKTLCKQHSVKDCSRVTTVEAFAAAFRSYHPGFICGAFNREMKREPGGFCMRTGKNVGGHCEAVVGVCTVKGGSSGLGGDGAGPDYAGDSLAFVVHGSWGPYLGSKNNTVQLASGRTYTLRDGDYMSTADDILFALKQNDSGVMSGAVGYPAQSLPWAA